MYKQNYENITDIYEINSKNQYLKYENAAEIYESVVTHGPLDIEFMMGQMHADFSTEWGDDPIRGDYFKKTDYCEGMSIYLGRYDVISFAPNGDDDKFYFDVCKSKQVYGVWVNVWTFSMER